MHVFLCIIVTCLILNIESFSVSPHYRNRVVWTTTTTHEQHPTVSSSLLLLRSTTPTATDTNQNTPKPKQKTQPPSKTKHGYTESEFSLKIDQSDDDETKRSTINSLLQSRHEARQRKDYNQADDIRDTLWKEHNIVVNDKTRSWSLGGVFHPVSPSKKKKKKSKPNKKLPVKKDAVAEVTKDDDTDSTSTEAKEEQTVVVVVADAAAPEPITAETNEEEPKTIEETTLDEQPKVVVESPDTPKSSKQEQNQIGARNQPKLPEEEARLQAKYGAIEDDGERAYAILLDLGVVNGPSSDVDDKEWEEYMNA